MSNLIDYTYFRTSYLNIPNIDASGTIGTTLQSLVGYEIAIFEPEYLTALLGETLYSQFLAGLVPATPDAKWTALKNKLLNSTSKQSQIANYVYVKYLMKHKTYETGTGEGEGAKGSSPTNRICLVWNDMVKSAENMYGWLNDNITDYSSFDPDLTAEIWTRVNPFDL
jgi:hypothetical protein